MNEPGYPQCSWGGGPYVSEQQGRPLYVGTVQPHHRQQQQETMYGPPTMTCPPPSGGMRGMPPAYHHRSSPAAPAYYASTYMDSQSPSQAGPMTSPNPRTCYSINTPISMDTTTANTSGYTSPGTTGRIPLGDDYMTNPGVLDHAMKPSANPTTPTSSGAPPPDHRWFSSAQMCLP